jgi:hypothetical protein
MVGPGLPERIISPAILLAKTSLNPGDTDIKRFLCLYSPFKVEVLNYTVFLPEQSIKPEVYPKNTG